jgi:hypothetical protein
MNPVAVIRDEVDVDDQPLGQSIWLWCPACDLPKRLPVNRSEGTSWDFDGNIEAPTLSPSILQHGGGNHPQCHSFLRSGMWDFLSDCTHSMAGQQVPMVSLPDWLLS